MQSDEEVKELLFAYNIGHMNMKFKAAAGGGVTFRRTEPTQLVNPTAKHWAHLFLLHWNGKGKGKTVPLQAWSGQEGSRKLMFPDFMTTARDGGKVVSLTHRPPLTPGNTLGTHFC